MVKNKIEQKIESNDKIGIAKEKAKQIRIPNGNSKIILS